MPAINHTDQELFARVQQRDPHAFDAFYHRHFEKLYTTAYRHLKDQNACKDIVHDVFLDLWQRANSIDNTNIEAYLHTAVKYWIGWFNSFAVICSAEPSHHKAFNENKTGLTFWEGRNYLSDRIS